MKVLFFGTPQIAVPILEWLIQHHTVVGVVCRPDEPVGRGYKITPPPTKVLAQQKNIPVFQPEGPWSKLTIKTLKETGADVGIVVAYGRIMPESVLNTPRLGCINLHFSLLPLYRGAAPIQWALIKGETKTGVTAFWLDHEMDAGPIFHHKEIPINPQDDAITLREKLIPVGMTVLEKVFDDLSKNNLIKNIQVGAPSFAPPLKKEIGNIDWSQPASHIVNLVRGVVEWPGAKTHYSQGGVKKQLKIFNAHGEPQEQKGVPGTITAIRKKEGFVVKAGEGQVFITQVQPEGKKSMPAWDFLLGSRLKEGDQLG